MADIKISDLTEQPSPADDDLILMSDESGGNFTSKKTKLSSLYDWIWGTIANLISGDTLTVEGTLTDPRTLTMPDQDIDLTPATGSFEEAGAASALAGTLGSAATADIGTGSGDVAEGDHTHGQLHDQNMDTGTDGQDFAIGDGTDKDVTITAQNADANKPKIKYDKTTNKWQFSHDGTTFKAIGAGGLDWLLKSTTYTAEAGQGIFADTSGGAWTLTLPASPAIGDEVAIIDVGESFLTDNLTLDRNGENIQGEAEDMDLDISNAAIRLIYCDATTGWRLDEMGGGGGSGGGGGAWGTITGDIEDQTDLSEALGDKADASALGTAAAADLGTDANDVVQLDGDAKLPAVDGSQLTNLPAGAADPALNYYKAEMFF